ncbi:hypothetical protein [Streptomyces sp. NPDC007883]|uniref:hypothetical protein n=1 Tax=Streptomyces sp. NPDC007883 TaxID=3155116 RepID=UPI00340E30D8
MVATVVTTRASGRRAVAALLLGFAIAARRSELRLLDWADVADVEEGLAVDVWRPKVNHEGPLGVPYGPTRPPAPSAHSAPGGSSSSTAAACPEPVALGQLSGRVRIQRVAARADGGGESTGWGFPRRFLLT